MVRPDRLDAVVEAGERALLAELAADAPWDRRLRNCWLELVDLVVEQPESARACLLRAPSPRPEAASIGRAARTVRHRVRAVLDESPERADMPDEILSGVLSGLLSAVRARLRAARQDELRELGPPLLEWALSYRTPPEALRTPSEPAPPRRDSPRDWPQAVGGEIAALLRRGRADSTVDLHALLADGLEPHTAAPDAIAGAIEGGIHATIHDRLRRDGPGRLHEAAPTATFLALAPVIGTIEACAVVNTAAPAAD